MRENAPALGNLVADFDFTQAPRPPVILPLYPTSTLVPTPGATSGGRGGQGAGGTAPTVGP